MPHGAETREKIFLSRAEDLRHGLAFALDDRKVVLGDPEETLEEPLAVEELAGLYLQHPAFDVLHSLFAAESGGVKPEALFGEEQRLDLAEVAEVFFGEDEAHERRAGLTDQLLFAAPLAVKITSRVSLYSPALMPRVLTSSISTFCW